MRKIAVLALITSFFLSLAAFSAPLALAQGGGFLDLNNQEGFSSDDGDIAGQFGQSTDNPTDVRTIVARFIKIVLTLLGVIFLALMVFGGFKWMTASGNESQVEEAKKLIIQAVIGVAIVLSAYGLTFFIFDMLLKSTGARDSNMFG